MTSSGSNKETNSEQIRRLADRFYEEVKAACVDDCANPIVSPTAFGFKRAGSDGERAEQLLALTIYGLIFELCMRKFNPKIVQVLFPEEPFTPREFFDAQKDVVAEEYGRAGKPDKAAFARYMADYKKGRTREHRLGSGSEDPDNMKTYLKKLLREKKYRDTVDRTCELVKNGTYSRLVIPDHFFKKPGRRKSGSIFKKVVPR